MDRSSEISRIFTSGDARGMIFPPDSFHLGRQRKKITPYTFKAYLASISKEHLCLMLRAIKKGFTQTTKKHSPFTLFEDIMIISTFKLNQKHLDRIRVLDIYIKLAQLLNRPVESVKTRFCSLRSYSFSCI